MRQYILNIIYFCIPLGIMFYIRPIYLLIQDKYKDTVVGQEVYISIKKSKEKSNQKILLIGDSVGNQMFSNKNNNDSINSLACNQAIGVIGQYFLLNNYLKEGNKPKEVYMIYTPFSFKNNLNQVLTFHYFLKPFYKKEYINLFSSTAINQINKIPFSEFCHEPYILTSNWAPNFTNKDSIDYTFLSPISKEYLSKIKTLCTTNNIDFYIIPAPTKEYNKAKVMNINREEITGLTTENELLYFLNNVNFLADSLFVDKVHLKLEQTKIAKDLVLKEIDKARMVKNNTSTH